MNRRAHRNVTREISRASSVLDWADPSSHAALEAGLARFAASRVDTLVIDGGDGTIRDVLSAARPIFGELMPSIAIVPSGKTNALAIDLGVPPTWTLEDAIDAACRGRTAVRCSIEITRPGECQAALHGFLFGTGAFVKATELAQRTHRMGAFRGLAVGMALAGAVLQTLLARSDNDWRRGEHTRIVLEDGAVVDRPLYLALASTLQRMPLGLKPFGAIRPGLKLLGVDAPPRLLLATAPVLLSGSTPAWLKRSGYHQLDADAVRISTPAGFILDGELFRDGELLIRKGAPVRFLVP